MPNRARIPNKVKVEVLIASVHTCCICHHPGAHVQIHHIDGNPGNNALANLAVLCVSCHSRVTGDEGLGQRYSHQEVLEYKIRWEAEVATAQRSRITTLSEVTKWSEVFTPEGGLPATGASGREYYHIHHDLTRAVSTALGLPAKRRRFRHDDLERLTSEIDKAGLLRRTRPNTIDEYNEKPFVLETVKATKVFFPSGRLREALPSLRELVVWISDPSPRFLQLSGDRTWKFDGAFLYLIGSFWDDHGPGTLYSGCSALQVIANVIHGEPPGKTDWSEPLGRKSFLHPVEKLKQLGGIAMDSREYEVLYRNRHMSNEQCFLDEDTAYRVHDLLAYPIFMALRLHA